MSRATASTVIVGVVGAPVAHSLSPTIHNAWIEASGIDAVYVAFGPMVDRFRFLIDGLRGGVVRGLNVTAPFKEMALEAADRASDRALAAGAANLLVFDSDGGIRADNTDGVGLLHAFGEQAPGFDPRSGPVVLIGAGGAARGAAVAFLSAGAPAIHIVNRSDDRGESLARHLGPKGRFFPLDSCREAFAAASAIINAASAELHALGPVAQAMPSAPPTAVVMDMVYRPLRTAFLERAVEVGLATVDGLAMLIGQAAPSFEQMFDRPPPIMDIRALVLKSLRDAQ
jgi:shikimate dehydrogenase